jgi:glycosyltransferase involved in cell wall biosynthesis
MLKLDIQPKKVSVVIATYNGSKYIERQLRSLLNQTYPIYEVVISDDNSTDGTVKICEKYRIEFAKFVLVKNSANIGPVKNFENAINLSTGEFIAFCDQDDEWYPMKIEKLINAIGQYDLVHSDARIVNNEGKVINQSYMKEVKQKFYRFNKINNYFLNNNVTGCTMLGKSSFIKSKLPVPIGFILHDWWFAFCAKSMGNLGYIDEPLMNYVQHDTNLFGVASRKKSILGIMSKRLKKGRGRGGAKASEKIYNHLLSIKKSGIGLSVSDVKILCSLIRRYRLMSKGQGAWLSFWIGVKNYGYIPRHKRIDVEELLKPFA